MTMMGGLETETARDADSLGGGGRGEEKKDEDSNTEEGGTRREKDDMELKETEEVMLKSVFVEQKIIIDGTKEEKKDVGIDGGGVCSSRSIATDDNCNINRSGSSTTATTGNKTKRTGCNSSSSSASSNTSNRSKHSNRSKYSNKSKHSNRTSSSSSRRRANRTVRYLDVPSDDGEKMMTISSSFFELRHSYSYLDTSKATLLLGACCCAANIVLYVVNGEITRVVESANPPMNCPFFLIWLSHILQTSLLPFAIWRIDKERKSNQLKWGVESNSSSSEIIDGEEMKNEVEMEEKEKKEILKKEEGGGEEEEKKKNDEKSWVMPMLLYYKEVIEEYVVWEMEYDNLPSFLWRCLALTLLYVGNAWCWCLSIGDEGMSVGIVTAIFNTNPIFIFIFTALIYNEGADDCIQIVAIILAMIGVLLISYHSEGEPTMGFGLIMAVVCAAQYGLFEVLYKHFILHGRSDPPLAFIFLFVGFMGFFILAILWIPIPLLHFTGFEVVTSPTLIQAVVLFCNALCVTAFQCCLQVALAMLPSPLLVGLASLLCMPVAELTDWFLKTGRLTTPAVIGSAFVGVSFVIMIAHEARIANDEKKMIGGSSSFFDTDDEKPAIEWEEATAMNHEDTAIHIPFNGDEPPPPPPLPPMDIDDSRQSSPSAVFQYDEKHLRTGGGFFNLITNSQNHTRLHQKIIVTTSDTSEEEEEEEDETKKNQMRHHNSISPFLVEYADRGGSWSFGNITRTSTRYRRLEEVEKILPFPGSECDKEENAVDGRKNYYCYVENDDKEGSRRDQNPKDDDDDGGGSSSILELREKKKKVEEDDDKKSRDDMMKNTKRFFSFGNFSIQKPQRQVKPSPMLPAISSFSSSEMLMQEMLTKA